MKKKTILIIDDSETSTLLVKSIFEEYEHFKVEILLSSLNAVQKIKEINPDLILLDVMMPDVDGITLLKQIKNDDSVKHIPVIIVSALDNMADVQNAKKHGAEEYVRKPIGLNHRYERASVFLEKSHKK